MRTLHAVWFVLCHSSRTYRISASTWAIAVGFTCACLRTCIPKAHGLSYIQQRLRGRRCTTSESMPRIWRRVSALGANCMLPERAHHVCAIDEPPWNARDDAQEQRYVQMTPHVPVARRLRAAPEVHGVDVLLTAVANMLFSVFAGHENQIMIL